MRSRRGERTIETSAIRGLNPGILGLSGGRYRGHYGHPRVRNFILGGSVRRQVFLLTRVCCPRGTFAIRWGISLQVIGNGAPAVVARRSGHA
jgi:hypothetical protein